MKTKGKMFFWEKVLILFTILFVIVSSVYVILNGAVCDFALLTMFRLKAFNGDLPMKSIYGPYALSSWFLSGEYHILYWLFKSNEYGILLTKILGVIFQLCVAAYFVFHETKNGHEKHRTVLCALVFFLFLPDYLYCFVSHYNVIYLGTLLLVIILSEAHDSYPKYICSSIVLCISVLANPVMALLYIGVFIYIVCEKIEKRYLLVFVSTTLTIGLGILSYLFLNGLQLENILNLLKSCNHSSGTIDLWKRLLLIWGLIFCVIIYHVAIELIGKYLDFKFEFEILVCCLILVTFGILIFMPNKLINCMRCSYFVILILGIWASIYGGRECIDKKAFNVYKMCGIIVALLCGVFTYTGIMICSIGMIIPVIGYLHLRNKGSHLIIYVIIVLLLCQRMIIIDGNQYCTGFDCKYIIDSGIMKGIHVTEYNYERYQYLNDIVKQNVEENDKVLFITEATDSYVYSMSEAEICSPGNEYTTWDNEYYLDYYSNNPNKIPTKIVIIGESYIHQFGVDFDDEFMAYIRENYHVTHQDIDVKVLERNI